MFDHIKEGDLVLHEKSNEIGIVTHIRENTIFNSAAITDRLCSVYFSRNSSGIVMNTVVSSLKKVNP